MPRLVRRVVAPLAAVAFLIQAATAQEFRVFTAVYNLSAAEPDAKPPVVARSLTLAHAGKVYDYLDVAGEVLIYEPTARRFRVLNPARNVAATAALDEIRQLVKVARGEVETYSVELAADRAPGAASSAALLRFQLDPRFRETFDEPTGRLSLDGGTLRYDVTAAACDRPGVVPLYLDYADWVVQVNYLVHPGPLLPNARLAVNQALRTRDRLPTAVELTATTDPPIHVRAEHTLHWELDGRDRDLIHQWETQLKSPSLRNVTLRTYQDEMRTAKPTR